MALRLTLIAHARTTAQKQARFATDEPVEMDWASKKTERAHLFGRQTRFLCGPEQRARQTAGLFSYRPVVAEALRDCDFGHWKGVRVEDVEPSALEAWMADWRASPHGGESIKSVCERVSAWMDSLCGTGHIVAVTHPFIVRAALIKVLQCPPSVFHAIDVEPLSAVDLRFNGIWRMRAVSLDALPQALV